MRRWKTRLARHAATPGVGAGGDARAVSQPGHRRRPAGAGRRTALAGAPLARATQHYVERLHELSAAKPGLLVAHAYVRYLGDLNGGQALRRVVARSLGLADGTGTQFYDFGDSADAAAPGAALPRRAGGGGRAAARTPQALADEALSAFERHEQLVRGTGCA